MGFKLAAYYVVNVKYLFGNTKSSIYWMTFRQNNAIVKEGYVTVRNLNKRFVYILKFYICKI